MDEKSGLTIRQHVRHELELPIEFAVHDDHCDQVRFSATSGVADARVVPARTIDISTGGVGVSSHRFLPRGCRGVLRILDPQPVGARGDGSPILEVAFEHAVQVRRVSLTGHEPTYFIGMAFIDAVHDLPQRIKSLLMRLVRSEPRASGEAERDA